MSPPMALNSSPRKVVPLATGDEVRPSRAGTSPALTRRVFFCGVVVEGSERILPDDIQELVLSLGEPLSSISEPESLARGGESMDTRVSIDDVPRKPALTMTDSSALADVLNELVSTERSYVKRLQILKNDYADPLRKFAKNKETAIIQPYEANTLFGNIDNLLPVNEAFLTDLEKMMAPNGAKTVGGIGDVALRHFKDLKGFEHYRQYYAKREEAQRLFVQEITKRNSAFAAYLDRVRYIPADLKSRVGLRELLMDPVQRIPRYTLLFRSMIKHMSINDPQRAKLSEADDIASKIALAEDDEVTKQAAIIHCFQSIENLLANVISHERRYIDCIDVEDIPADGALPATGSSTLHCTLFLFDDKLVIAKRPGNGEKGRTLIGLDELDRPARAASIPTSIIKKSGMVYKGQVDLTAVVVTDVGGADMHMYLEDPPQDQTERWSGRPFRSLAVVIPPAPINYDPTQTEIEKQRFLENLWTAQARYRSSKGQSVVLRAEEREVEAKGGKITRARAFFNIYTRTTFLMSEKKTKVVVHIDALGSADPIPFGTEGPPFVRIRLQPMAGGLCRYTVDSSDANDEGEEDIVQTSRVPSRIVQTIHQFGLFKFHTGNMSQPGTPTASMRSRAAIFSLDAISRHFLNQRPAMGDFFSGSINSSKRSKSTASKSSTYTQSTSTGDDSLTRFSSRSSSTMTAATTVEEDPSTPTKLSFRSRKLLKRSKSQNRPDAPRSRTLSRPNSFIEQKAEENTYYSDPDDDAGDIVTETLRLDPSERDLAMRLELARKNSQSQHGIIPVALSPEKPSEETIYEDEPPAPLRLQSRASRDSNSLRLSSSKTQSPIETQSVAESSRHSRSISEPADRRPIGPRSPSPLPPSQHSNPPVPISQSPSIEDDLTTDTAGNIPRPSTPTRYQNMPSGIPRSKRQPLFSTDRTEPIPQTAVASSSASSYSIEPLSIKKKTSDRTSTPASSLTPTRKTYPRHAPLSRIVSPPRRVSPHIRPRASVSPQIAKTIERLMDSGNSAKEQIQSSQNVVGKIKLELEGIRRDRSQSLSGEGQQFRPQSPGIRSRTPQQTPPAMNKAAMDRMEEMRQLISKRQLESPQIPRPRSRTIDRPPSRTTDAANPDKDKLSRLEEYVEDVENHLSQAAAAQATMQTNVLQLTAELTAELKEKTSDNEKLKSELQHNKRAQGCLRSLLDDSNREKDIMYEAFNEELDKMYEEVRLPDHDAWAAMCTDLWETKASKNAYQKELSQLKRRLVEAELQAERRGLLLRTHGITS